MYRLPEGVQIKRIVNYLRRSREDAEREKRTGEDTIAMQRAVMDRVLKEYGIPYDQVTEIGSGERIESRPVFRQVLNDLANGVYNCIAVKEISRMTRGDFHDYGSVYELLRRKRIFILTPYRLYDPKNLNDMRQIRFEMFLSREEFETIRERMQGAKYAYAMSGRFMGSTPAYGYRTHPQTQRLVMDPEEAEIVRLIYQLYLHGLHGKGMGYRAIASLLTRCGIPSPAGLPEWNPTAVKKILQNPVYIGEIRYSTTVESGKQRIKKPEHEWIVVPDAHPAIIPPHQFHQAQRKQGQSRLPSLPLDQQPAELSGLIRCGQCGKKMVRQASRTRYLKRDGSMSVYEKELLWCTTVGCTYVKYRAVEEMLLTFLDRIEAPSVERINQAVEAYISMRMSLQGDPFGRSTSALRKQRADLQKRLSSVYQSFEAGVYSSEEFIKRRGEILRQLDEVSSMLKEAERITVYGDPETIREQRLRDRLQSFAHVYHALTGEADKNKLLRSLIESVRLTRLEKRSGNRISPFMLEVAFRMEGLLSIRF
jgi:site-specific DNA recombinase